MRTAGAVRTRLTLVRLPSSAVGVPREGRRGQRHETAARWRGGDAMIRTPTAPSSAGG